MPEPALPVGLPPNCVEEPAQAVIVWSGPALAVTAGLTLTRWQVEAVHPTASVTVTQYAVMVAGLAVGYWKDMNEIQQQWQAERYFSPDKQNNTADIIKGWNKAVKACKAWAED